MKKTAVLIQPHDPRYHREREMLNQVSGVEGIERIPNLGLLSVASCFDDSWELDFIDEDYLAQENLPRDYLHRDYHLACLTAMNHQAPRAYEIGDHFRSRGIPVVMGGMHASALPGEACAHVDTVITGEGEQVMAKFLRDLESGSPGKTYRSPGTANLASLPPPRFDLIPDPLWYDKIPLFATRGCPRKCRFCCLGQVYGPHYRKKTPRQVALEVQHARQFHPDAFITFADENMLVDRAWARQLARKLKPLNIKWEAYCDVSVGEDPELLDLLAQSGCVELLIGFETLNPRSLKEAEPWKARQIDSYGRYIRQIQQAGIGVLGCFVVGFDDDDPGTFDRLKLFLDENPLFELDIASLTPMPGTPLFDELARSGRIIDRRWHRYTWYHVNFQPMRLTPREITEGIREVFRHYNSKESQNRRRRVSGHIQSRLPHDTGRNSPGNPDDQKPLQ